MKKNIHTKLGERGLPSSISDEFLSDIFGKHIYNRYEEGLVDAVSSLDFKSRLHNCKDTWNAREAQYLHPGQVLFFDYFVQHYSKVFENTMLKTTRSAAGLGCPPQIFTTNSSESLNATIKRKVNFKESEWPQFNESMRELVLSQRDEVIRSLSGRGQYRVEKEYTHVVVAPERWMRMTPEQRKEVVKRFDSLKVKCGTTTSVLSQSMQASSSVAQFGSEDKLSTQIKQSAQTGLSTITTGQITQPSISVTDVEQHLQDGTSTNLAACGGHMSISAEDSNISILPRATLEGMWNKAEDYLQSNVDVVAAPGGDPKAKMVTSRSGSFPHLVQVNSPGQYICDKNCLQSMSSQICAHTLVSAEVNGELHLFLQWYNMNSPQPNISSLAMTGLPRGRGRKGGIPKRTRSKVITSTDVVVSRATTMQSPGYSGSTRIGSDSVAVPVVATSQCSGMRTVSVQVGDNFRSSQSLIVNAEQSPLFNSQNITGNIVGSPQCQLSCQTPNTNPQSLVLQTQSIGVIMWLPHHVHCLMEHQQLLILTHFMCVLLLETSVCVKGVEALLSVLMVLYLHHHFICVVHVLKNGALRITMVLQEHHLRSNLHITT